MIAFSSHFPSNVLQFILLLSEFPHQPFLPPELPKRLTKLCVVEVRILVC